MTDLFDGIKNKPDDWYVVIGEYEQRIRRQAELIKELRAQLEAEKAAWMKAEALGGAAALEASASIIEKYYLGKRYAEILRGQAAELRLKGGEVK